MPSVSIVVEATVQCAFLVHKANIRVILVKVRAYPLPRVITRILAQLLTRRVSQEDTLMRAQEFVWNAHLVGIVVNLHVACVPMLLLDTMFLVLVKQRRHSSQQAHTTAAMVVAPRLLHVLLVRIVLMV